MPVNTKELIKQMEEVASRLDQHEASEGIAEVISDWVTCVEALEAEIIELKETAQDAEKPIKEILGGAVSAARGYQPLPD